MLALLDWIYGPNGHQDPYYQVMHDLIVLMPDWYGYLWLVIIVAVVGFRSLCKLRRRALARRKAQAVMKRTHRILRLQRSKTVVRQAKRLAANDNPGPRLHAASTA